MKARSHPADHARERWQAIFNKTENFFFQHLTALCITSVAARGSEKKVFGFVKNRSPSFPRMTWGIGTSFHSSPNPQNGPENDHLRPQSCPRQGHAGVVQVVWFECTSGDLRRQNYRQRSWGDRTCIGLIRRLRGRRGQTKYRIGLSITRQNHAFSCTLLLH